MTAPMIDQTRQRPAVLDLQVTRGGAIDQKHRERDEEREEFDKNTLSHDRSVSHASLHTRPALHGPYRRSWSDLSVAGCRSPDVAPVVGHGVIGAQDPRIFLLVALVIGGVHQEAERGFEDIGHLPRVGLGNEVVRQQADEGRDRRSPSP